MWCEHQACCKDVRSTWQTCVKPLKGKEKMHWNISKKTSTTNALMLNRQHAHMGIFFPAELSEFALQFYNWNPKVCQFIITSTHSHIHTVSCLGISMNGTAAKMTAQKPFGELLGLFARRHVDTCLWRERKRAEGSSRGDTEETQTVKKMKIREERQKGKACKTEREKQSQRWKRQRALLWSKCAASFKHLLFLLQLNEHITSSAKLSVTHTHTHMCTELQITTGSINVESLSGEDPARWYQMTTSNSLL